MTTVSLANCEGKGVTYDRFVSFCSLLDHSSSSLSAKQANKQQTEMRNNRKLFVCFFR